MLSEKTIKELISTPAFLSNASKLAGMLHMSRQDASQELLIELLSHRLHKWSDKDVEIAIAAESPSLKWKVKYARKALVRKQAKSASREVEKAQMVAHMTRQASNEAETLEALERLQELFKNKATKSWAESLLRVAQKETMVRFHQTPRQFNNKLVKVCKYARQRQPKQSNSHTKELKLLKEWDDLITDPDTSDSDVQAFIGEHEEYIDNIIDDPQVAFQGHLIKDFAHAGKDKYILVNLMAKREQELKEKSNELS